MENIEICNEIKLKDDNLNTLNNLGHYYTDRKNLSYMCKKFSNKDNDVVYMCDSISGTSGFSNMNNNVIETTTNSIK